MQTTDETIDIIDKLIINKRKSRTWTIISVLLFLLMATFVLIFSKKLADTKGKLSVSENKLVEATVRLQFINDSIQRANDSVKGINYSLTKLNENFDSLQNVNDTLTALLNKTQQTYINISSQVAGTKINDLYKEVYPEQKTNVSETVKESIINTKEIKDPVAAYPIVYIQFMPDYKDVTYKTISLLKDQKTDVQKPELITGSTFNPVVKYFHKEDQAVAERIANILNKHFSNQMKQQFTVQNVSLKAPLHQLEIWIGDYRPAKINPEIQKVLQYKKGE
jgi:hypothetical protein